MNIQRWNLLHPSPSQLTTLEVTMRIMGLTRMAEQWAGLPPKQRRRRFREFKDLVAKGVDLEPDTHEWRAATERYRAWNMP